MAISVYLLLDIFVVKRITAPRTEFRRFSRIFRFPSALVTFVERFSFGFFLSAILTEFALVYRSAGAGPTFVLRFRSTAFGAEFSADHSTAGTFPRI